MLHHDLVAALWDAQAMNPWRFGIIAVEQIAQAADHHARITIDRGVEIGVTPQRLGRDRIGLGSAAAAAKPVFNQILQQARQDRRAQEQLGLAEPLELLGDDLVGFAGLECLVRFRAVHATLLYPLAGCVR